LDRQQKKGKEGKKSLPGYPDGNPVLLQKHLHKTRPKQKPQRGKKTSNNPPVDKEVEGKYSWGVGAKRS